MIKAPVFYISEYFEANRDNYYEGLRLISEGRDWEHWVNYFLEAVATQADQNALKANQVISLYQEMKTRIADISNPWRHSMAASPIKPGLWISGVALTLFINFIFVHLY